eukprot:TRINITY_DN8552_c0_g2_i1.p1 TRINITY_DN8552_c0_g2~~TRINITY_DN8552_c0_g2_i1.p1  ORF type:complete len:1123 (+),score=194.76 TRINITY_DN8552_c0_g2_i1:84-3452(+)
MSSKFPLTSSVGGAFAANGRSANLAEDLNPKSLVIKYYFKDKEGDPWNILKTVVQASKVKGSYLISMLEQEGVKLANSKLKYYDYDEEGYISMRPDDVFHLLPNEKTVVMLQIELPPPPAPEPPKPQAPPPPEPPKLDPAEPLKLHLILGQYQQFRVPSSYSCAQLLVDAASHFRIPAEDLEIRLDNSVLSQSANLFSECQNVLTQTGTKFFLIQVVHKKMPSFTMSSGVQSDPIPAPAKPEPPPEPKATLPAWKGIIDFAELKIAEWGNVEYKKAHPFIGRIKESSAAFNSWFNYWKLGSQSLMIPQIPCVISSRGIGKTKFGTELVRTPWIYEGLLNSFLMESHPDHRERLLFLHTVQHSYNLGLTLGLDFKRLPEPLSQYIKEDNVERSLSILLLFLGLVKYAGYSVSHKGKSYDVPKELFSLESLPTFVKLLDTNYAGLITPISIFTSINIAFSIKPAESFPAVSVSEVLVYIAQLAVQNPYERLQGLPTTGVITEAMKQVIHPRCIIFLDNIEALSLSSLKSMIKSFVNAYSSGHCFPVFATSHNTLLRQTADGTQALLEPYVLNPLINQDTIYECLSKYARFQNPTADVPPAIKTRLAKGEDVVTDGEVAHCSPVFWSLILEEFQKCSGSPRLFMSLVEYLHQEKYKGYNTSSMREHLAFAVDTYYGSAISTYWGNMDPVMVLHLLSLSTLGTPLYLKDTLFPELLLEPIKLMSRSEVHSLTVEQAEAKGFILTFTHNDGRRSIVIPELFYALWRRHFRNKFDVPEKLGLLFSAHGLHPDLRYISLYSEPSLNELFGPEKSKLEWEQNIHLLQLLFLQHRTRQLLLYRHPNVLLEDVIVGCPDALRGHRMLAYDRRILKQPFPHKMSYDLFKRDVIDTGVITLNPSNGRYPEIIVILEDAAKRVKLVGVDCRLSLVINAEDLAYQFFKATFRVTEEEAVDHLISVRYFATTDHIFPDSRNKPFQDEIAHEVEKIGRIEGLKNYDRISNEWKTCHSLTTGLGLVSPEFHHRLKSYISSKPPAKEEPSAPVTKTVRIMEDRTRRSADRIVNEKGVGATGVDASPPRERRQPLGAYSREDAFRGSYPGDRYAALVGQQQMPPPSDYIAPGGAYMRPYKW